MNTKIITAEFYALHAFNAKDFDVLSELLKKHDGAHAPSISLDKKSDGTDADEKYQIRSISASKSGKVVKAVFGRCRFNENLEQASEKTDDKDVELLPGHGLVEKNHFLFFSENNLIAYQKNGNGSGIGKLQRYLTRLTKKNIALEAVLTEDSYKKLIDAGPLKRFEASIVPPKFSELEEESSLYRAVENFKSDNATRIKITLSANAGSPLSNSYKEDLVSLARAGWAKVARATVRPSNNVDFSDDADLKDQIIDLISNKIRIDFEVKLDEKNKPAPNEVWHGLAQAKDKCNAQLKAFFDPE